MKKILTLVVMSFLIAPLFGERIISINISPGHYRVNSQSGNYPALSGYPIPATSWTEVDHPSGNELVDAVVKVWNSETGDTSTPGTTMSYKNTVYGAGGDGILKGFFDGRGPNLVIKNIPYKHYDVIVYQHRNWGQYMHPVAANGTLYRWDAETQKTVVGNTEWGSRQSTMEFGKNVLKIEGLVGATLTLNDPATMNGVKVPGSNQTGGAIAAVQIIERTDDIGNTKGVISVNFASSATQISGKTGDYNALGGTMIPAASWNDVITGAKDGDVPVVTQLKVWDGENFEMIAGETSGVTMTRNNGGYYSGGGSEILYKYIDSDKPGIVVSNIPWKYYDVILYYGLSWGSQWFPAAINGNLYTWDEAKGSVVRGTAEWGSRDDNTPVLGSNTIRVNGLSGSTLTMMDSATFGSLKLPSERYYSNGHIAAFQIIRNDSVIEVEGDLTVKELNKLVKADTECTLVFKDGARLTLSRGQTIAASSVAIIGEGDFVLDTDHELTEADEADLAKIDLSAVKGLVYHAWEPTGMILSLNFESQRGAVDTSHAFRSYLADCEMPGDAWNNLTTATPEKLNVWDGRAFKTIESTDITFKAEGGNTWYSNVTYPEKFQMGLYENWYTLTIGGLDQFKNGYDVILYMSSKYPSWTREVEIEGEKVNVPYQYCTPSVNGQNWTWSEELQKAVQVAAVTPFGEANVQPPKEGVNVLRIPNLKDPQLVLQAVSCPGKSWCTIAAVQIVEHPPKRRYTKPFVLQVR